jgi:hypothetical protein
VEWTWDEEAPYNLEVGKEHCYQVREQGVFVATASVVYVPRPHWPSNGNEWGVYDLNRKVWVLFQGKSIGNNRWAASQAKLLCSNASLAVGSQQAIVLPILMQHIVGLEWNAARQNIAGGHCRPPIDGQPFSVPGGPTYTVKVIAPNASGSKPYSANIQLLRSGALARTSAGSPLEKSSEMFPDSWGPATIEAAIEEAFLNAYDMGRPKGWHGRMFVGMGGGIWIIGFVSNAGNEITSAYPKL